MLTIRSVCSHHGVHFRPHGYKFDFPMLVSEVLRHDCNVHRLVISGTPPPGPSHRGPRAPPPSRGPGDGPRGSVNYKSILSG